MGRSLTIHQVAPHFAPETGGLEQSVARFANWLARAGHRVIVHTSATSLAGDPLPPFERVGDVEVVRYVLAKRAGYFRTWFRPRIEDGDVVHLHGYAVRTNDYVARSIRGVPMVYSLHHGVLMPHPMHLRPLRALYDHSRGIPTLRSMAAILVANRADSSWLERHGIPRSRIRYLPTPLPDEAFTPGDPGRGRMLAGARRYVLYLGRLEAQKGVANLLTAVAHTPECRLVFAGPDGGMLHTLRDRAAKLGVSERVAFLGYVTEEDKRALIAGCRCLALPSSYEAQGLVVLEAWAQSRPVVATRVGGLADLINDDGDGLLVPLGHTGALVNALRRLWEADADGDRMGTRGHSVAERYRVELLGRNLESIYEELTSR